MKRKFCVKILYRECREIAKELSMVLVKYHVLFFLKKTSNQKYLILQNHLQIDNSYPFPKAIFYEC